VLIHRTSAEFSTDSYCPWSAITAAPQISDATGSDEAVACVRRWLDQCISQHDRCAHTTSTPLPTRILRIYGPDEVKLHISNEDSAQYVCLSHCWGKSNIIQTTMSTIVDHQAYIKWETLPKTFQEAISFAHRLGFKYVWIDSLCIIQDSDEDWQNEGSQMASIYKNAILTLVATRSPDSDGGCFTIPLPKYHSRNWSFTDANNMPYQLHSRTSLDHWPYESNGLPLLKRAWALQERLLSPRLVHFTDNELVWECLEAFTCECSKIDIKDHYRGRKKADVASKLAAHAPLEEIDSQWQEIISSYSAMSLTFPNDIFPALQGLAKTVPPKMGTYLAGLWSATLLENLSWDSASFGAHPRPKEWRAPTWSWASTTGKIFWMRSNKRASEIRTFITILSATTSPRGADAMGELVSGELIIRCRLLDARVLHSEPKERLVKKPLDRQLCKALLSICVGDRWIAFKPTHGTGHHLRWDYEVDAAGPHHVADGEDVAIVKLEGDARRPEDVSEYYSSLWLIVRKSVGDKGAYERIGVIKVWAQRNGTVEEKDIDFLDRAYDGKSEMEMRII